MFFFALTNVIKQVLWEIIISVEWSFVLQNLCTWRWQNAKNANIIQSAQEELQISMDLVSPVAVSRVAHQGGESQHFVGVGRKGKTLSEMI